MKTLFKHLLPALLFAALSVNVSAQNKDSVLLDNEIVVNKKYVPILSEAIRIPVNPNPEKPELTRPEFSYKIPEMQIGIMPTIYPIKPLAMGTMLLPKLKNNYLRLGYGNYNIPIVEVYLNSVRNKQYQAGFFAKHLSGNGDKNYNNFSNNTVYGYIRKFNKKGTFNADAYYFRNGVNLYGSPNDVIKLSKTPELVYNLFDIKTGYKSNTRDSSTGLSYQADLNYYLYSRNNAFTENDFQVRAKFGKQFNDLPFELETGLRVNNNKIEQDSGKGSLTYQRVYFDLNPQLFMNGDGYYLRGGFNSTITGDSTPSKFHLFPKAEGGFSIIPSKLTVLAGFRGGLTPVTYRNVTSENPFATHQTLSNTITKFEVYGGFKGELTPLTSFQVISSSATIQNLVFYTHDSLNASQTAQFETKNARVTTLLVALQHQMNDKFRLGITTTLWGYELKTLSKPYSRPTFETKLNSTYNIGDKFLLKLDVLYWGQRYGLTRNTFAGTEHLLKLNPFTDINFGIDYRYSKKLSAFVTFNNIGNNKYQRFANYPVYGFNVLGGFTFTF